MQDDILYTPEEIALKLKISKYTVYEMIKRGDIEAHRIGRILRISSSQLNKYISSTRGLSNIYNASITEEKDETYALVDSVKISVNTDLTGSVKISIQPEDIILSTAIFSNSARNALKSVVTDILVEGSSAKVFLDAGIPLIALITKRSLEDMNIQKGTELYAIFKTMAVKIFK